MESRRLVAGALLGPATVAVALGLLVPLAILFRYSLNRFVPGRLMVEALTLENYVKFFTDPYYVAVLLRTLRVAGACMALCLLLGFPLAYALARTRSRWKSALIMLVVLPLFVGNAVRAAGWMVMFGSRGLLNTLLGAAGLIHQPLQLMYTEGAVIVGITAVNLPFMVLALSSVIEGIDPALEEAALNLGARPIHVFWRVILPLAMPGVLAGAILVFILGMNAYATPILLGGPRFQMMGPVVYGQFAGQNNWPFGAALSFVLMAATLALSAASHLFVQRRYRAAGEGG
jgi:putative spermidine/putrescine transport system permease protein